MKPTKPQYVIKVDSEVFAKTVYFCGHTKDEYGHGLSEFHEDIAKAKRYDDAKACAKEASCSCMAGFIRTLVAVHGNEIKSEVPMETIDEAVARTGGVDKEAVRNIARMIDTMAGLDVEDPERDPRVGVSVAGSILANLLAYFAAQAIACNGKGHSYINEISEAAKRLSSDVWASHKAAEVIRSAKGKGDGTRPE